MNPILVRRIQHLTDARYFAAMGVDWISMVLSPDPASFMRWHTLKDWVEGVRIAAEIDGNNEMLVAKTIIDAQPDGIIFSEGTDADIPSYISLFRLSPHKIKNAEEILILDYTGHLTFEKIDQIPNENIFLEANWSEDVLMELLQKDYTGGISISGGEEEATGIRDYTAVDRIFEILGR